MKNFLAVTLLVFSTSAFAGIEKGMDGVVSCVSANPKSTVQMKFTSSRLLSYGVEAGRPLNALVDDAKLIVVSKDFDGEAQTQIGRRGSIDADQAYKSKKYTNHMRFDLNELVNTEDFGDFAPMNDCLMSLLIPHDAGMTLRFDGTVTMKCNPGGGAHKLACKFTPKVYGL